MPRACTVCADPRRVDVDADLVAGWTLRNLEVKYGISRSALHRHVSAGHSQRELIKDDRARDAIHEAEDDLTPPSDAEWEDFVTQVMAELAHWPSTSIKIADRLKRHGLGRYSPIFVSQVPRVMLLQAVADKSERRDYVPSHWLEESSR